MSIFSSLSYLLKKASYAFYQTTSTEPSSNFHPNFSQNLSFSLGNNSLIKNIGYDEYLHFFTRAGANVAGVNTSFENPKAKFTKFSNIPTSIPETYLETETSYTSESDVQYPYEPYYNADHLLESWWNIFDERYMRHGWGWTIALIIAYMLILVVGVVGNLMVILVVSLRPQMRTVTNMFIMNLAVADLLVVIFCVPSTLLANIFAPWILGSFLCKAVAYVQGVAVCASAYSLAAVSLDRCQAIYRNLERPRGFSQVTCIAILSLIWAAAITLTIPWAIMFNIKISEYDGLRYCVETWKVENHGNIYFLSVNLLCFYIIPLLLIFISNWIIYLQVMRRRVPEDSSESSAPVRKMHRQTRHDVLKMLGIVTLTFLFSWLPLYSLVIIIKFTHNMSEWEYNILEILMPIAQWLGSWNSSMNPILYAFLNKKFRRMFKSMLPAWIPVNSPRQYQSPNRIPRFSSTAYRTRIVQNCANNQRDDNCCHYGNGHKNCQEQKTLLICRYRERTENVATTMYKHRDSTSSSTSHVSNSRSTDSIFRKSIYKRSIKQTVTDL